MSLELLVPKNPLIVGYTTRRHLLLDLDDSSITKVRLLAFKIIKQWPEVGDCLVLKSSNAPFKQQIKYTRNGTPYIKVDRSSFHLVFDNDVGFNKCCTICETLAGVGVLERDYEKIRTFRGDMTLRVSDSELTSGIKKSPHTIEYLINDRCKYSDNMIREYLRFRRAVLRLFQGDRNSYASPDNSGESSDDDAQVLPVYMTVQGDHLNSGDADKPG